MLLRRLQRGLDDEEGVEGDVEANSNSDFPRFSSNATWETTFPGFFEMLGDEKSPAIVKSIGNFRHFDAMVAASRKYLRSKGQLTMSGKAKGGKDDDDIVDSELEDSA